MIGLHDGGSIVMQADGPEEENPLRRVGRSLVPEAPAFFHKTFCQNKHICLTMQFYCAIMKAQVWVAFF